MAEQPTTANHRPPLFNRARGTTLKGSKVELLGTPDNKPLDALRPTDQVWVRQFAYYSQPGTQLKEANVAWRNLERAYRTKDEETLGRDCTVDEAAEHERATRLRVARQMADHRAESITSKLTQIAERLERAAEEMRQLVARGSSLDQKVYQVQHELAWLFPNLGVESLTTDLVGWLQLDGEIKRLGGASDGPND